MRGCSLTCEGMLPGRCTAIGLSLPFLKSGFCDGLALFLSTFAAGRLSVAAGLFTVAEGLESFTGGFESVAVFLSVDAEGFFAVTVPFLTTEGFLSTFTDGFDTSPDEGLATEDLEVEPGAVLLTPVFPDDALDDDDVRDSLLRVWASASA